MATTSFSWKCFKNRVLADFQNLNFWAQKGVTSSYPFLSPPPKKCWPLASLFFSPFALSQEVGGKKTLLYRFFCHPLSDNLVLTSTNNHHNKKFEKWELKKRMATIPFFWKACFCIKTPESDVKLWSPSWKTWFAKVLWNHNFHRRKMMWSTFWPNQVDHFIDSKKPKMWTTCWPYSIYIYICTQGVALKNRPSEYKDVWCCPEISKIDPVVKNRALKQTLSNLVFN